MNLKNTLSKYSKKPKFLFKKIFVTLFFTYLPFLILYMTLAVSGIMPVNFNDEKVYGLKAIIIQICFLSSSFYATFIFRFVLEILRFFLSFYQMK
jgi:hypothetical protein